MSSPNTLVRNAVVGISAPGAGYDPHGAEFWGSGFFIAPTWVLTCAHVVGDAGRGGDAVGREEQSVSLWWPGGSAGGTVRPIRPAEDRPRHPDREPAPDLALVHVPAAQDPDCAWISHRSAFIGASVSTHGWSLETDRLTYRSATGAMAGEFEGISGAGELQLRGEHLPPGLSGGPVLDRDSGAVIGVCRSRHGTDPTAGLVVPVTALRPLYDLPGGELLHEVISGHDLHHLNRSTALRQELCWTDVQLELHAKRPVGLDPLERTRLFGHLASLGPPATSGEVSGLVDAVHHRLAQQSPSLEEHRPRSWREGVGLLCRPDQSREPTAVVLYAARVFDAVRARRRAADAPALRELAGWLRRMAEPLIGIRAEVLEMIGTGVHGARVGSTAPRAAVRVVIRNRSYGDRHPWEIKLVFREDGVLTVLHSDDTGARRSELRDMLAAPLADALGRCDTGGRLADLQFIVPRELFDEPFDHWRLFPEKTPDGATNPHGLPLGHRRNVFIRDLERTTLEPTEEWRRRWVDMASGPLTAIPLRVEVPQQGHNGTRGESWHAAYARFSGAGPSCVPVFCGPVGSGDGAEAMDAALVAGHPVALWRNRAARHSDCADFQHHVELFVADVYTADELHGKVKELRIRTADPAPEAVASRWGHSIAVLFDPPDDPPEDGGAMHEPYQMPGVV